MNFSRFNRTAFNRKLYFAPQVEGEGDHTDFFNALIQGVVINDGNGDLSERRIVFGETDEGEVQANWDNMFTCGSGYEDTPPSFQVGVSELNDDTTYYFKVNATNPAGTGWSVTGSFHTPPHPNVTINNVDRYTISNITGFDVAEVKFEFDTAVSEYKIKVLGVSHDSGTLAGSGAAGYLANEEITEYVDDEELQQEGSNRINIYGKEQTSGYWSKYNTN